MTRIFCHFVALSLALLVLGGCVGPRCVADVTQFHDWPERTSERRFMVLLRDKAKGETLEFTTYARHVVTELEKRGFRQAKTVARSDILVLLDYSVDAGTVESYPVPVYGYYPDEYRTVHGVTRDGSPFSAHVYHSGSYEPIGYAQQTRTIYKRNFSMDIVAAPQWQRGKSVKRYEGRVVSVGPEQELVTAVPKMIEALFTDFPGASGTTRTVVVSPKN
jgi:hypothetical protein